MFKKMTAMLVLFAMLVPFSPAVAADNSAVQPTVEEILSEYHEKAFEAQTTDDSGGATTWSRSNSGSSKTLEQEAVDTLTEAGYEAYNVTADNYDSLEADLNTDLSSMGIEPDGSYIMVVNGGASTYALGDPGGSDIVTNPGPVEGSSSYYEHNYEGRTYRLRYFTVTALDDSSYGKVSSYDILGDEDTPDILANLLNTVVSIVIDEISGELHLGTIASILGLDVTAFNSSYTSTSFSVITMYASSSWTRTFTEVYNEVDNTWTMHVMVQKVETITSFGGQYLDHTGSYQIVEPNPQKKMVYSTYYADQTWQANKAVYCFKNGLNYYDRLYKIEFTYGGKVVMTHHENF